MNILQDMAASLAVIPEALQAFLQAFPLARQALRSLGVVLPLAALLAFAGMGFLSTAARVLAVTRRRSSYEKLSRQLGLLGMCLGWLLLVGSRIWLFLAESVYPSGSLLQLVLEISWTLLGMAVLCSSLYFTLWKHVQNMVGVHVMLGIASGAMSCLALLAALACARLLGAAALPPDIHLALPEIFFPGWLSPFWRAIYWLPPLILAFAGGCGALWLVVRRKADDYGRDHYNAALPWCAAWARNAWAVFWLLLLGSFLLDAFPGGGAENLLQETLLREGAWLLFWLLPAVLWLPVSRSSAPLRLKPLVLAALLAAVAFAQPYFDAVTAIALPAGGAALP